MKIHSRRYDPVPIKTALERSRKALSLRPAKGQGTAVTIVRMTSGYTCEISDGDWTLVADMPEKHGGYNAGPNPGTLGRGALGSCLSMTIVRFAALRGITIDSLSVEVHADYDACGEFAVSDVNPGYSEMRCVVTIESDAPEEEVANLIEFARAHTAFLDSYTRSIPISHEMRIRNPQVA